MSTIKVLYCRNRHISTPILRTLMWSPWSHQALIMGDELGQHVIDATFMYGVARRSLTNILADATESSIREIEVPRPDRAYAFARRQLGKKYDTLGVLGIGLHRKWQDDDRWFCSELVEAALAAGGCSRFETRYVNRVTPQHSWMVIAGVKFDSTQIKT